MGEITERERNLFESLAPIVEPLGVRLIDVAIKTHEERPTIQVVIHTVDGVDSETCRRVSENVGPVLALEDFGFTGGYDLEVSSPGVERRLRRPEEFPLFVGEEVEVTCYAPFRDQKQWRGILRDHTEEGVVIQPPGEDELTIPHERIASVRLFFDAEAALNSGGRSSDE